MIVATRLFRLAAAAAVAAALAGCATDKEPEFGSSVRHMITGQSVNPTAPATTTVYSMDGEKAGIPVKNYRADKSGAPAAAPSALVIPLSQ